MSTYGLTAAQLEALRSTTRGAVLGPDDVGYDEARTVWNGMYDREPAVVVQCGGVADVQQSIEFARAHGLAISIRSGGHSLAGASTSDGGMVIDLRALNNVRVDPTRRVASVGGGATWAQVDRETQVHGLATTGGMVSTTGVAGLTLGGGVGRFMRRHGLSCDNVLGYDIVTADGQFRHVDAERHPDLYWALKGGGGDFGVVTAFDFQLHPLGPDVYGGYLGWPLDDAPKVFSALRGVIVNAPEELVLQFVLTTLPPADFVPHELQLKPALLLSITWMGDLESGRRVIRPIQETLSPAIDTVSEYPYSTLQGFADLLAPPGRRNYLKSGYFDELDDEVAAEAVKAARRFPSSFSLIELYQMGGAISRVDEAATAFAHRQPGFFYTALGTWEHQADDHTVLAWCRDVDEAFAPIRRPGRYINFVVEGDEQSLRDSMGEETMGRLSAVKTKYDPAGVFSRNPNAPAPAVAAAIPGSGRRTGAFIATNEASGRAEK
jgi:FAD/FMN-containing dehydrogenase